MGSEYKHGQRYHLLFLVFLALAFLVSFSFSASAASNESVNHSNETNYSAEVDPEVFKAFENQTQLEVFVRYSGDIPVTEENELELSDYYENISIVQSLFSYIPETELNITSARLSAFKPSFIGIINWRGFEKLASDSQVISIGIIRQITAFGNESTNIPNRTNDTFPSQNEEQKSIKIRNSNMPFSISFILSLVLVVLIILIMLMFMLKAKRKNE